jgi:hypothetical protein
MESCHMCRITSKVGINYCCAKKRSQIAVCKYKPLEI